MAPGNTCDGDLLSSISRDSCRWVTRVKLQWSPPAPWSCVVGAQNTAIVARHQRLLLELTAALTLSWKKMFLGSIFPKSWSLLRHHPSLLQFLCISHTWGWLRPEETLSHCPSWPHNKRQSPSSYQSSHGNYSFVHCLSRLLWVWGTLTPNLDKCPCSKNNVWQEDIKNWSRRL